MNKKFDFKKFDFSVLDCYKCVEDAYLKGKSLYYDNRNEDFILFILENNLLGLDFEKILVLYKMETGITWEPYAIWMHAYKWFEEEKCKESVW